MSTGPALKDYNAYLDFVKSKGTIISHFPDSTYRPKVDFIIMGKIFKVVSIQPCNGLCHDKIDTCTIFYACFVDNNGAVTAESYRGVLIGRRHNERHKLFIGDIIAIKSPKCFCPVPQVKTVTNLDDNYWIYEKKNEVSHAMDLSSNLKMSNDIIEVRPENNSVSQKKTVPNNVSNSMHNLLDILSDERTGTKQIKHSLEVSSFDQPVGLKSSHKKLRVDNSSDLNNEQKPLSNPGMESDENQRLVDNRTLLSESCSSNMELTIVSCNDNPLIQPSPAPIMKHGILAPTTGQVPLIDDTLRTILNYKNGFPSKSKLFYSYGCFTVDTKVELLSDSIVFGYCESGCKFAFNYHNILWVNNESTSTFVPYCLDCGVSQRLKVFFYCPLKLELDNNEIIDLSFYSEDSRNYFTTDPVEYALHDSVRGYFRWCVLSKLPEDKRMIGYDLYQFGDEIIPFFSDVKESQD